MSAFILYLEDVFLQPRYISFDYICTDSSEEVGSVGCGFIFAFDFFFFFSFLVFEYTLLCVLPCVRLHENVCACVLAGLCGCAQTTLCVNSSLAVGGQTPCVCVCVCVDWWGHSGVPGLLTTSPSPLSPLNSCSSPTIALFHPRLIWQPGRRRAGSESHRGTLLIFKHHTHASFLLPPPPPPPPHWSFSSLQEMRVQGVVAKQVFKKADWSKWRIFFLVDNLDLFLMEYSDGHGTTFE